jgi:hypothetical protein
MSGMRRRRFGCGLLMMVLLAALPGAQPRGQGAGAAPAPLDLVEIVGCLTRAPMETWAVTRAGDPVVSNVPWTTLDAVRQALARPLGALRFRLIGVSPFNPSAAEGKIVAVKGVLIKDAVEPRVNVTSLQTAGEMCPA